LNLNNYSYKGFTMVELMVSVVLSSILLIGFALLGSGIWGQLAYEDVHEKVQHYGNYVLDDMSESFKESDIERIRIDSYADGFSIVRVEFNDNTSDIKYSINYMGTDPLHENIQKHQINKNNQPIHKNNDGVNQYYNEFENKGYAVSISEFKCNELSSAPSTLKYGNRPYDGSRLESAVYIVDLQIEIYKKTRTSMELYNTIDFQRTLFVTDEFI